MLLLPPLPLLIRAPMKVIRSRIVPFTRSSIFLLNIVRSSGHLNALVVSPLPRMCSTQSSQKLWPQGRVTGALPSPSEQKSRRHTAHFRSSLSLLLIRSMPGEAGYVDAQLALGDSGVEWQIIDAGDSLLFFVLPRLPLLLLLPSGEPPKQFVGVLVVRVLTGVTALGIGDVAADAAAIAAARTVGDTRSRSPWVPEPDVPAPPSTLLLLGLQR